MLPRRIPFNQVAFAALLGVGGGIYIYRPFFEPPGKAASATSHQGGETQQSVAKQVTSVTVSAVTQEAAATK